MLGIYLAVQHANILINTIVAILMDVLHRRIRILTPSSVRSSRVDDGATTERSISSHVLTFLSTRPTVCG